MGYQHCTRPRKPLQQQAMAHERQVRARELATAEQHRTNLEEQERRLRDQLVDQETGFAQTELLHFIPDRPYELTPINFANALASLHPWRGVNPSSVVCVGIALLRIELFIANSRSSLRSYVLT